MHRKKTVKAVLLILLFVFVFVLGYFAMTLLLDISAIPPVLPQ